MEDKEIGEVEADDLQENQVSTAEVSGAFRTGTAKMQELMWVLWFINGRCGSARMNWRKSRR